MKAFMKKTKKIASKEPQQTSQQANGNEKKNGTLTANNNNASGDEGLTNPLVHTILENGDENTTENGGVALENGLNEPPETDIIDKKLPRELIIRIFSFLDTVSLCRCAQVSKVIFNESEK